MSAPRTPEGRPARGVSEEGSPGALRTPKEGRLAGDEQSPASTKDYGDEPSLGAPPAEAEEMEQIEMEEAAGEAAAGEQQLLEAARARAEAAGA